MIGKEKSIQAKVTALFVSVVVLCALIFGSLGIYSLSSYSKQQIELTEKELQQSVVKSMQDAGALSAERVNKLIEGSFSPLNVLAEILQKTATPNKPMSREQVKYLVEHTLSATQSLSATYVHFESNGYDAQDRNFNSFGDHSSPNGSLEIYWVREGSSLNFYPTDDPNEKYVSDIDENGVREAEWYLCSKDTKKACALDPYLYEINEGHEELMTTLTTPIVVNGQFRGIVGADINLPVVQGWIVEQANALFNGKSAITLVSQKQLIIASSKYPNDLSNSAAKTDAKLNQLLQSNSNIILNDDEWHVKLPINIPNTGIEWTLLVSLPKNVAMATVAQMTNDASDSFQSTTVDFFLFSIVFIVIAVMFALWLARSISSPIQLVSQNIQGLATRDGDLTQKVHIESHSELILLAKGFNQFVNKLAEMIGASKQNSSELVGQFNRLKTISDNIETDTKAQQFELDNIATAMTEMAATATEVSQLAAGTAEGGTNANQLLAQTQGILSESVDEVTKLESNMELTAEQIEKVAERSSDITSIVETIQSIAEQTNLLALNAAIEAARAGEQGRGFAVVADEVRSLAARTQSSTQDISDLISNLQSDVGTAVNTLQNIQSTISGTVEKTNDSFEKLTATMDSIHEINESSAQVATAAEEQSQVSEDINKRLVTVTDSSTGLAELGQELKSSSQVSSDLVHNIENQLGRLKC